MRRILYRIALNGHLVYIAIICRIKGSAICVGNEVLKCDGVGPIADKVNIKTTAACRPKRAIYRFQRHIIWARCVACSLVSGSFSSLLSLWKTSLKLDG
jgi:hypothetical protein